MQSVNVYIFFPALATKIIVQIYCVSSANAWANSKSGQ